MSLFRSLALAFTLAALLGTARTAVADPVTITSGVLVISGAPDFQSRGFRRSIRYDLVIDDFRLRWSEVDGPPQDPLAPLIPRNAFWTPTGGSEEMVFLDLTRFLITATPSSTPTPFSLGGRLAFARSETAEKLFDDNVAGSGIATWFFTPAPDGAQLVWQVRYDFSETAPVPEPATILLVGAGLCTALVRQRWLR